MLKHLYLSYFAPLRTKYSNVLLGICDIKYKNNEKNRNIFWILDRIYR